MGAKVTVFGKKKLDFLSKDGNQVKGTNVFVAFEANGVDGLQTDKLFLSDTKFGSVDIVVGADYEVTYNRYGKVDSLTKM